MRYTVDEKTSKQESGKAPVLLVGMWAPNHSKWVVLPVEQDDFDALNVGDVVELLVTVIHPDPCTHTSDWHKAMLPCSICGEPNRASVS